MIDEMRLVANTVKHGEGSSAHHLRAVNPALFNDPAYAELLRSEALDLDKRLTRDSLAAPLSGEDFFVTEKVLHGYAVRAEAFFDEIAADLFRREQWNE